MGIPADSRNAWRGHLVMEISLSRLKRMEDDQAQRSKTVRDLEDRSK